MKFFVCIVALATIACISTADKAEKKEGMIGAPYGAPPAYAPAAPSYAAPTYSAPPCPKNYLFSCQPNLAPVPCAAGGSSGGYAGAYSEHVPQYALPMPQYYYPQYSGVPQY